MNNNKKNTAATQQMLADLLGSEKNIQKVQSINPITFEELDDFRQQLDKQELGPFHQPYENQKHQANIYRYLFFGISLVFMLLMSFVHFRTASWICHLFFAQFVVAKTTLSMFCGVLAAISFFIAFKIRPEREAVFLVYRKAKQKLAQIYLRKCAEAGIGPIMASLLYPSKTKHLRHAYHENVDKMHEMRDSAISILSCIFDADLEKEAKIKLFNQAIIELREELNQSIKAYMTL